MQEETDIVIETELDKLIKESLGSTKKLMLYNDEVNSFDHVISCLVKYCGHDFIQAEQVANLVHYKGKCDVKNGDFDTLLPIYIALLDNKLKVVIE